MSLGNASDQPTVQSPTNEINLPQRIMRFGTMSNHELLLFSINTLLSDLFKAEDMLTVKNKLRFAIPDDDVGSKRVWDLCCVMNCAMPAVACGNVELAIKWLSIACHCADWNLQNEPLYLLGDLLTFLFIWRPLLPAYLGRTLPHR
jgi:hypothetical protein